MRSIHIFLLCVLALPTAVLAAADYSVETTVAYSGDPPASRVTLHEYKPMLEDLPNGKKGIESSLTSTIGGAHGGAYGLVTDVDRLVPTLGASAEADVPGRAGSTSPLSAYTVGSQVTFGDFVRFDLSQSSLFLATVGLAVHFDGSVELDQVGTNDGGAQVQYGVSWNNPVLNETVALDRFQPGSQHQGVDKDVILFPTSLVGDMYLGLSVTATANANNQSTLGPSSAKVSFADTVRVDGLVPYDAAGNVLPPDSLVFTSDSGLKYPVLAPEPGGLALLALATLLPGRSSPRRRRTMGLAGKECLSLRP